MVKPQLNVIFTTGSQNIHFFSIGINLITGKKLSLCKSFSPLGHLNIGRSTLCKQSKIKPIANDFKPLKHPKKIFLGAKKLGAHEKSYKKKCLGDKYIFWPII